MFDHSALLGAWREVWTTSPYPQLVDHRAPPERICPAPSLWSGGKLVAQRLRALGARPGQRLGVVAGGAAWVQAMVGARRARLVFEPLSRAALAASASAEGPHWLIEDDELEPRALASEAPLEPEAAWRLGERSWGEGELVAAAARLERVYPPGRARRVLTFAPWHQPEGALFLLSALCRGAELHFGLERDFEPLEAEDSWPEVLAAGGVAWARLCGGRGRSWARALEAGVVLAGDPSPSWGEQPWSMTSFSLAAAPSAPRGAAP